MASLKQQFKQITTNIWNVPNVLTMLRFALIPVFVIFHIQRRTLIALAVFIIASLTDALDGYIARSRNQITDFGKLMDPLADKLMVCTAIVCRVTSGVIPLWIIITVAVKQLILIAGSFFMLRYNVVVRSRILGKVTTCVFIAGLILSFFHSYFASIGLQLDSIMLHLAVVLTYMSLIDYVLTSLKQIKNKG